MRILLLLFAAWLLGGCAAPRPVRIRCDAHLTAINGRAMGRAVPHRSPAIVPASPPGAAP